jgi:hypothetical protein
LQAARRQMYDTHGSGEAEFVRRYTRVERLRIDLQEAEMEHAKVALRRECECLEHRSMQLRADEIGRFAYEWMLGAGRVIAMDQAKHLFDELEPGGDVG